LRRIARVVVRQRHHARIEVLIGGLDQIIDRETRRGRRRARQGYGLKLDTLLDDSVGIDRQRAIGRGIGVLQRVNLAWWIIRL
jgi:hypothetical protein